MKLWSYHQANVTAFKLAMVKRAKVINSDEYSLGVLPVPEVPGWLSETAGFKPSTLFDGDTLMSGMSRRSVTERERGPRSKY